MYSNTFQEIERECPKELAEVKARLESMNETLVNFPKITEEEEKVVDNLEQNIASHEKVVKTLMEEIDELQNELEQNQSKLLDGIGKKHAFTSNTSSNIAVVQFHRNVITKNINSLI